MTIVVRSNGDPHALASAVRQTIWAVDANQPIVRIETMEQLLNQTEGARRFAVMLLATFAFVAVVLAAGGCYGIMANYVAERTREIGIRSVLGATRGSIVAQVVRHGVRLAGVGVVLGLAGSVLASQTLSTLLFGLSRLDPMTYGAAAVLLMAVAVMASSVPAWRAARIDLVSTLKAE
jgi:putative ABC transport system permease protein